MVGGSSGHAAEVGVSASTYRGRRGHISSVECRARSRCKQSKIAMKVLVRETSPVSDRTYAVRLQVSPSDGWWQIHGGRAQYWVRSKWTFLGTVMPWTIWKLSWFNILSISFSSELTNTDWLWPQPDSWLLLLLLLHCTLEIGVLQWARWVVVDPKYYHRSEDTPSSEYHSHES